MIIPDRYQEYFSVNHLEGYYQVGNFQRISVLLKKSFIVVGNGFHIKLIVFLLRSIFV